MRPSIRAAILTRDAAEQPPRPITLGQHQPAVVDVVDEATGVDPHGQCQTVFLQLLPPATRPFHGLMSN
jgi:hypothetical protein